ncbi:MAG: hypothetical protein VX146_06805, partial [Pseudomonadota bacterium]|nr:hypothetical protein [Pseudomonadota bacterium]
KSGCRGKRRVVVVQPGGIGAVVEKAVIDGDRKPQSGAGVFGNEGVDRVMVIKALGMVARELMALVFRQQDVFRLGETQPMAHWRRPPGRARRAAAIGGHRHARAPFRQVTGNRLESEISS